MYGRGYTSDERDLPLMLNQNTAKAPLEIEEFNTPIG